MSNKHNHDSKQESDDQPELTSGSSTPDETTAREARQDENELQELIDAGREELASIERQQAELRNRHHAVTGEVDAMLHEQAKIRPKLNQSQATQAWQAQQQQNRAEHVDRMRAAGLNASLGRAPIDRVRARPLGHGNRPVQMPLSKG